MSVAALVLAAGQGTRFGPAPKLLADLHGEPLVRHAVKAALASSVAAVLVVVGHHESEIRAALAGLPVTFVPNPDYAGGLSTSLRAGFAALPEAAEAAIVLLGDMPRVTSGLIDRLVEAFEPGEGALAVVPVRGGRRGNPVLFSRVFFPELQTVTGDVGGRGLLGSHAEGVVEVPVADDAAFLDVDTPEALHSVRSTAS